MGRGSVDDYNVLRRMNQEHRVMQTGLTGTCTVVRISFWASIATPVLFVPMTMAALMSTTGKLAFSISKLWARFLLFMTNVHPRIRNDDVPELMRRTRQVIIDNYRIDYPCVLAP